MQQRVVLVEERRSGAHIASEPELLVRAIGYAVARTSKGSCCVIVVLNLAKWWIQGAWSCDYCSMLYVSSDCTIGT
jgi:hypothetical protein